MQDIAANWIAIGLLLVPFGLIVGLIAKAKGESFFLFFVFGAAMFVLALPYVLFLLNRHGNAPIVTRRFGSLEAAEREDDVVSGTNANGIAAINSKRSCPFCGEEILTIASKCKHCHSELLEVRAASQRNQYAPATSESGKDLGVRYGLAGATALVIALVIVFGYPLLNEGTISPCNALEVRATSTAMKKYGEKTDTETAMWSQVFAGALQGISNGALAKAVAKSQHPNIPSPIACTLAYYNSVMSPSDFDKKVASLSSPSGESESEITDQIEAITSLEKAKAASQYKMATADLVITEDETVYWKGEPVAEGNDNVLSAALSSGEYARIPIRIRMDGGTRFQALSGVLSKLLAHGISEFVWVTISYEARLANKTIDDDLQRSELMEMPVKLVGETPSYKLFVDFDTSMTLDGQPVADENDLDYRLDALRTSNATATLTISAMNLAPVRAVDVAIRAAKRSELPYNIEVSTQNPTR